MKNVKSCANCIWFGKCFQEGGCEDYYPMSPIEADEINSKEFNQDLRDRHEYYQELIFEQNN